MAKLLNSRIQQKYDTSSNWTTNNPVLLKGEMGIESDTRKIKIGDGSSAWNSLSYISVETPSTPTFNTVYFENSASSLNGTNFTVSNYVVSTSIYAGTISMTTPDGGTTYHAGKIDRQNEGKIYTYTYPSKTGTFALTNDIPSDYVKLTGNQTIDGTKTFNKAPNVPYFRAVQDLWDYEEGAESPFVGDTLYARDGIYFSTDDGDPCLHFPTKEGTIALIDDVAEVEKIAGSVQSNVDELSEYVDDLIGDIDGCAKLENKNYFAQTQTIKGNDDTPLNLQSNHASWANIAFSNNAGTRLGNLGVNGYHPYWWGGQNNNGQIALQSDFKTINGNSLIGSGDITVSASLPNYLYDNMIDFDGTVNITSNMIENFGDTHIARVHEDSFHVCDEETSTKYKVNHIERIDGVEEYLYTFPNKNGTIALTSDIPSDYVKTSGDQEISGTKTFKGLIYTDASTPFLIGKSGKVGLRASNSSNQNLGQFNITDSLKTTYDNSMVAQMSAMDKNGDHHSIKVSGLGPMYGVYKNNVTTDYKLALEKDSVLLTGNQTIGGTKTFNNAPVAPYFSATKDLYEDEDEYGIISDTYYGRNGICFSTDDGDPFLQFPLKSGTIALTSDITSAGGGSNWELYRMLYSNTFVIPGSDYLKNICCYDYIFIIQSDGEPAECRVSGATLLYYIWNYDEFTLRLPCVFDDNGSGDLSDGVYIDCYHDSQGLHMQLPSGVYFVRVYRMYDESFAEE